MSTDKPLPPDTNMDRATKRKTAVSLVAHGVPRADGLGLIPWTTEVYSYAAKHTS